MWCSLNKHMPTVSKIFFFKYVRFHKTSDVSGSMSGDLRNHCVSYLGIKISSSSASWAGS